MRTFSAKPWLAAVLCLSLSVGAAAYAAPAEEPQVVAQKVYTDIKANLTADTSNALVDQYFDTHAMAAHALARSYRGLSDAQKTSYVQAFDTYFKHALYHVLTTYKDVTISQITGRVEGSRAIVRCTVTPTSGQPVDLALSLESEQDHWKANDVFVDNVSLIDSYKPQFESLYKQSGVDGLVGYLGSH
jgi:phospholipid transport system substrate-binding protein